MSVQIERWIFNVDDYHRMAEAGILTEDDRVELIEGEIIKMSSIGSRHAGCVNRLTMFFARKVGQEAIVSVQNPFRIGSFSEPQPDITLLKARDDFYSQSHATPEDVLLVIEVADSSIGYDRKVKMYLYARAGIQEAWVVNLPEDKLEAYSKPVNGSYQRVRQLKRGQSLKLKALSSITVSVDEILG